MAIGAELPIEEHLIYSLEQSSKGVCGRLVVIELERPVACMR
jgi:hypothetical protein